VLEGGRAAQFSRSSIFPARPVKVAVYELHDVRELVFVGRAAPDVPAAANGRSGGSRHRIP
jgi:hypothetical protein